MKRLMLVRHAKSSWDFDWSDRDRPLNDRGIKAAYDMGKRFKRSGIRLDHAISSPANRALHTAIILLGQSDHDLELLKVEEEIYSGFSANIIDVVRVQTDDLETIACFGHNPGTTEFVNRHQDDKRIDNMATCAIACIEFDIHSWKELTSNSKGKLIHYDFPKNQ